MDVSMRPSADRSRESGAVLPIFALLIVILLAFAALAVDLGAAWAQRRQSQTAADAGVMAAALQYLRNTPPDQTGIFELVNLYANANLSGPDLTYDDWHNCTDPDRPADYAYLGQDGDWEYPSGSAASTPCISLKQADDQPAVLRVRLPDTDISTAFARVVGIDTIAVTAAAEAEILYTESSRILPFSLPSEPNLEECLGTPPTGLLPQDVAPCEGSTQGNFGMVDSPWFGAGAPYGTDTQSCPNDPNFRSRTPLNLALGLDHIITSWPDLDGDELTYDGPDPGETQSASDPVADSCDNVDSDLPPYILLTEPGNTQTGSEIMQAGFLEGPFGTAGTYGRFRQTTGTNPTHDIAVTTNGATLNLRDNTLNVSVDNVGLWEYLDFDGNSFNNTACAKKSFEDAVGRQLTEQMSLCLDYIETLEDGQYFTDDILTSPRFALVPVLNYERGSQYGSKWWAVMELRPVYVQTSWYLCGQPTGDCLFQPDDFENYTPVNAPVWVKLTSPAYGSPLTGSITVNAKTGGENGAASVSF